MPKSLEGFTYENFIHLFIMDVKFLRKIDDAVKEIMKDGKIDQNDVPTIVMLITELSASKKKMTKDELEKALRDMFDYIMEHYKLLPDNESEKESFQKIFDMSVKLVLLTPNLKKICSVCLGQ
jgi:fructose-1,6-bisphosphatase